MALIGDLVTRLKVDGQQFGAGLKTAETKLNKFAAVAVKVGGIIGTVFAARAAITNLQDISAEFDKMAKTASKLGIAAPALQELAYAAELSGVSTRNLSTGLQRMVRRVSEAAVNTGAAQKALRELGLDAEQLSKLSPDKQFKKIAESMRNVGNQGDKVRLAMQIFDTEGVGLVNTFNQNLEEAGEKFRELGGAINKTEFKQFEALNDEFTNMITQANQIKTALALAFGPLIVSALRTVLSVIQKITGSIEVMLVGLREAVRETVGLKNNDFELAGYNAARTISQNEILARNLASGKDTTITDAQNLIKNGLGENADKAAEALKKLSDEADMYNLSIEKMSSRIDNFFKNNRQNETSSELNRILAPLSAQRAADIKDARNPAFDRAIRETSQLINKSAGLTGSARTEALKEINSQINALRGAGSNQFAARTENGGTFSTFGRSNEAATQLQRSIVNELDKFSKQVLGTEKSEVLVKVELDDGLIVKKITSNKEFKGQVINVGKELAAQEAASIGE